MATRLRFVVGLARWVWRGVVAVALVNLAMTAHGWWDRRHADGERAFFRGAERADDWDYGLAEFRIINESTREYLVDQLTVDDWGGPMSDLPEASRTLARAGERAAVMVTRRNLDHLLADGVLLLRDRVSGERLEVPFQVDRRRPVSCIVEVRLRDDGAVVSACAPFHQHRAAFRWLFGPRPYGSGAERPPLNSR